MSRYARRRDGNHGTLVAAFLQAGCTVIDTAHAGIAGWPDVVVGCMGQTHLVELKNPATRYGRAGLNDNQQAFVRDWRGGPVFVVSTVDEVLVLVRNWRRNNPWTPTSPPGDVVRNTDGDSTSFMLGIIELPPFPEEESDL